MLMRNRLLCVVLMGLVLIAVGCVEETSAPAKGSFENPAEIEEIVVLSFMSNTYEVSVNEFIRGTWANNEIIQENMFNEKPPGGYEYLLVKMQVEYVEGGGSAIISNSDFKAFCEGVECDNIWVVLPDSYKEFTTGEVMPGGIKDGWLVYIVPKNKEVVMSYRSNSLGSDAAYISIGTELYKN